MHGAILLPFLIPMFAFCVSRPATKMLMISPLSFENTMCRRPIRVHTIPKSLLMPRASTSDGTVWYSESGVKPNTVVAFNPKTKSFYSWPVPSGGAVVRNMVATPDDHLYLACRWRSWK